MENSEIDVSQKTLQFARLMGVLFVVFSVLPTLFCYLIKPPGWLYVGHQINIDDHMVYASWIRQASEGRIFFENRFTTDSQPGLTIHVWFLLLGWISMFFGLFWTTLIAKSIATYAFVQILARLILKLNRSVYTNKLAITLGCIGGGCGYLVWQSFGRLLPESTTGRSLFATWQPIDIWQPEAFVFPSMLTSGLFMISLCLIVSAFCAVLECKKSWLPVVWGGICLGVLMNIHSYDVLLVGLVMLGLLAQSFRNGFSFVWLVRVLCMWLFVVPSALWFVHVLQNDPVFAARAATPTYSAPFRALFFGIMPMLALVPLAFRRSLPAFGLCAIGLVLAAFGTTGDDQTMWLSTEIWLGLFALVIGILSWLKEPDSAHQLFHSWVWVGLIAPYFPAAFQRKLLMGMAIPVGVIAAVGTGMFLERAERTKRNIFTVFLLIICCASSFRWLFRELDFAKNNVSSTTVHPVYLSEDASQIIGYLSMMGEHRVCIAPIGVSSPTSGAENSFDTPLQSDLNPFIVGLAGCKTYAGHWSETPDYTKKRAELSRLYNPKGDVTDRVAILAKIKPKYIVVNATISDPWLESLGKVVLVGSRWKLVIVP